MFMKRALELARCGAGLVSPNPMVGAVLVKDGRVVGEGFHRYDRLRHAESYAIEMAGELARGATLYCNLEPCCHHGRTPPCTDGLIEAGIARAVIAAKDPDSRVSGQGIEQLRAAGIRVEVGLCERETLRLNESYFKYVISGVPFVHGVVGCADGKAGFVPDWNPSRHFLDLASEHDMIGLGHDAHINRTVLSACLARDRHRQLIVIAANKGALQAIPDPEAVNLTVINVEPATRESAAYQSDLALLLKFTNSLNVNSLLALPGFLEIDSSSMIKQSDKLTAIVPQTNEAGSPGLKLICSGVEIDIEDAQISGGANYTELTGYPRSRQE
jgi:pyrimidine deaminase RibD-like protein